MPRFVVHLIVAITAFIVGIAFAIGFYNRFQQTKKPQIELNSEANLQSKPEIDKDDVEVRFVCKDEVIKPIWNELLKDNDFTSEFTLLTESGTYDCSEMLRFEQFKINESGRTTGYAVFVKPSGGAKGNCLFYVYENSLGRYKRILKDRAVMSYQVKNSVSSYGYFDIVTEFNGSPYDNYLELYQFTDDSTYQRKRCFKEQFNEENEEVKIVPTKCWNKGYNPSHKEPFLRQNKSFF